MALSSLSPNKFGTLIDPSGVIADPSADATAGGLGLFGNSSGGGLFGAGGFDNEKLTRLLMGLALLDAGRSQINPPSTASVAAPFMQMLQASGQKKLAADQQQKTMDFLTKTMQGAPPAPGMEDSTATAASAPAAPQAQPNPFKLSGGPGAMLGGNDPSAAASAPPARGNSLQSAISAGSGSALDRYLDIIPTYESGGRNIRQQVVGPNGGYNPSTGTVTGPSSASGLYQMVKPTWQRAASLAGIDTKEYPEAIDAPPDVQREAARALLATEGPQHWIPYNANLRRVAQNEGLPLHGPLSDAGPSSYSASLQQAAVPPGGPLQAAIAAASAPSAPSAIGGLSQADILVSRAPSPLADTSPISTPSFPNMGRPSTPAALPDMPGETNAGTIGAPTPRQAFTQAAGQGQFAGVPAADLASATRLAPATPPPTDPRAVSGNSQAVAARKSFEYWGRAMAASSFLGDAGAGLRDLAKQNMGLAEKWLSPTDLQRTAATIFPGDANAQRRFMINASTDNSPEHAAAVAQQTELAKLPIDLYKQEQNKRLGLAYDPLTAGATTLAQKQAGLQTLPQEERIKADEAIRQAKAIPDAMEKQYDLYVRGEIAAGRAPVPPGEWDLTRRRSSATSVTTNVQGDLQKTLAEHGIKRLDEAYTAERAANTSDALLGAAANAAQYFQPGATAEIRLKAKQIMSDVFGIPTNAPDGEALQMITRHLQISAAPKGQGSTSNYERSLYSEAVPNILQTPGGFATAIDMQRRLNQYDRDVAQKYQDSADKHDGIPNINEVQREIRKLGPPLHPAETAALESYKQQRDAAAGGAVGTQSGQGSNMPPMTAPAAPTDTRATPRDAAPNPPRVLTKDVYDKLGPGTVYLDANGVLRRKGGQ
jgi:hypothetical protein